MSAWRSRVALSDDSGWDTSARTYRADRRDCSCTLAGPARWSPDGRSIAFAIALAGMESRIFVMETMGPGYAGSPTRAARGWRTIRPGRHRRPHRVQSVAARRCGRLAGPADRDVAATRRPLRADRCRSAAGGALIEWSPDGLSILSLPNTLIDAYRSYPNGTGSVARPVMIDIAAGSAAARLERRFSRQLAAAGALTPAA